MSPVSRALIYGRDVRVALLGDRAAALLVYHPFSGTVNAFTFAQAKVKKGVSGWQRASDLSMEAGVRPEAASDDVFFVSLSSAPDLDAFWGALNNWRTEPRRFFSAAAWVSRVSRGGETNISDFDLFSLFTEFSKLNSSNFIVTEAQRKPEEPEAAAAASGPAPRVEVFNASGKKDLASVAAKYLRAKGFDVLTAASYAKREKQTRILGFSGDTAAAVALRSALGLEELEIRVRPSQKSVAGAAVILGEDFDPAAFGKQ